MGLAELYPTMAVDPAPTAVHVDDPNRREIDLGNKMYPTMAKPVGYIEPSTKQADALATPTPGNHPQAVTSQESSAPILTEETLAAIVPPEVQAERDARGNAYGNSFSDLMRNSADPQATLLNAEIGRLFDDHGVSREDASSLIYLARKFGENPPDDATVQNWRTLVTPAERAAADAAMARNPMIKILADTYKITESPQLIRALASRRK